MRTIIVILIALIISAGVTADGQPVRLCGINPCEDNNSTSRESSRTVWELADLVTGPIPAISNFVARTPLIGELVPAPQTVQARTFVHLILFFYRKDLINALRDNPNYTVGERKEIEEKTKIEPRFFDTTTAFRKRMIDTDDALSVREQNASDTAHNPKIDHEDRARAMSVLTAIVQFRETLGVPPRDNAVK